MYSAVAMNSTLPQESSGREAASTRRPSASVGAKYACGTSFTYVQMLQRQRRPPSTNLEKGLTYARHFLQRTTPAAPKLTTGMPPAPKLPGPSASGCTARPKGSDVLASSALVAGTAPSVMAMYVGRHWCAATTSAMGTVGGATPPAGEPNMADDDDDEPVEPCTP